MPKPNLEHVFTVTSYVVMWASLLYFAFTLVSKGGIQIISYLYFSAITVTLALLASLVVWQPMRADVFAPLAIVTVTLLMEEILLNSLYPETGIAVAFIAALAAPLAGSFQKLGAQGRYALQSTGLLFASRLIFIPFPQNFLKNNSGLMAAYAIIISTTIAFFVVKRIPLVRAGLTRGPYPIYKQVSVGASLGLVTGFIEYSILSPSPMNLTGNDLQPILNVIIAMTVFVGFGEELLFRGLVQESYQNVLPPRSAILLASIQFAIMNYGWLNPLQMLFSYGMGVSLGYLFWKTKSLVAAITAHALCNIVTFLIAAYNNVLLSPTFTGLTITIAGLLLLLAIIPKSSKIRMSPTTSH